MPITVEVPGGATIDFPDDTPPDEIKSVLAKHFPSGDSNLRPDGIPKFQPKEEHFQPPEGTPNDYDSEGKPWQALSTPLINLVPRGTQENIGRVLSAPANIARDWWEAQPEGDQGIKTKLLEKVAGSAPSDKAIAITTGVQNASAGLANFFTSPIGIATLGIGALPAMAQKVIALGFAAQMAKDTPEIATQLGEELGKPEDQRDTAKIAELVTSGGANAFLTAAGVAHGAGRPIAEKLGAYPAKPGDVVPTPPLQLTTENKSAQLDALAKGNQNALQERSAETVPLEKPPGDSGTVGQGISEPEKPTTAQSPVAAPETPPNVPAQVAIPAPVEGKGGLASAVRAKWARATEEGAPNPEKEGGSFSLAPLKDLWDKFTPAVKSSAEAVKAVGKEALNAGKMTDYRRGVLNWSAKLQRSFGESNEAQKEIRAKVPDPVRRDGVTNWIQAAGDRAVLAARAAATTDPKLRRGYEAALSLTPEEINVARDVKATLDTLGLRGQAHDVLNSFKQNYVTQVWDLKKGPTGGNATRTLKDKFRFSRASTFDSYFDGEQVGFKPKTKDIAKILPMYIHEMNSVIAARQLVAELGRGVASDGRPLIAPRGVGVPVDNAGDKATLVFPKAIKDDTADYKVPPNQPAFNGWRWAAKDDAGNSIFLKSDLAIHPEAYARLKNVLGKSAIREWYNTKTSAAADIPKGIVKGVDAFAGGTKRTMLGLFAPFHQVQEGTHALGHRVNPFSSIPKIDLVGDAHQMDAAKHGLMLLPDRASADQFMEGFKTSGLVSRIPGIGKAADWYSHYLFHQYIPGLKYKTYQAILERNLKVYADKLASGEYKPEDVKVLSAEQTNAAYGHLNYADLGRNQTMQHVMQMGLLAPDFLEARGRFVGQAAKGLTAAKVGREQLLAVATLAVGQMALAYIGAKTTGGEWVIKRPFEFRNGHRTYTMRSVPEDAFRLVTDTRSFIYNRLNPIIGKGAVQLLSGVDWRGQKVTPKETLKELAQQPVPLMLRGLLGLNHTPLSWWEQMANAVGIKISRYSPSSDIHTLVSEFKKNIPDQKLQAEYERDRKTVNADSDYKPLRDALSKNDLAGAQKEYEKLLETKKADLITRTIRPYSTHLVPGTDYYQKQDKPFTGSQKYEAKFKASLSSEEMDLYKKAQAERSETYKRFKEMLKQRKPAQ